jgi:hypothetical protein
MEGLAVGGIVGLVFGVVVMINTWKDSNKGN